MAVEHARTGRTGGPKGECSNPDDVSSGKRHRSRATRLLVGGLVGFVLGFSAARTQAPAHVAAPPVVVSRSLLEASVPTLTRAAQRQVVTAAMSSQAVQPFIYGRQFQIIDTSAWTTSSGVLLGGVVSLQFQRPEQVSGQWLSLRYDCREQSFPPYHSVAYAAMRRHVTTLTIVVSLPAQRVVAVSSPSPAHLLSPPPPTQKPSCTTP